MSRFVRRYKKAVMGGAVFVGTLVVLFVPNEGHNVQVILGALGALLATLAIAGTTNEP